MLPPILCTGCEALRCEVVRLHCVIREQREQFDASWADLQARCEGFHQALLEYQRQEGVRHAATLALSVS